MLQAVQLFNRPIHRDSFPAPKAADLVVDGVDSVGAPLVGVSSGSIIGAAEWFAPETVGLVALDRGDEHRYGAAGLTAGARRLWDKPRGPAAQGASPGSV